jgi:hypothetical protein
MPVLSHLHQLFNAEQCQAYICTRRWKDRPLQCPRCQSHHIGQWGMYQYRPGCKRYWCHSCKRTFNDLTDPCCIGASDRWLTGSWPPFCCVSPVPPGALPGKWASMSGPAIAGAGGYAMPRSPMRCSVS